LWRARTLGGALAEHCPAMAPFAGEDRRGLMARPEFGSVFAELELYPQCERTSASLIRCWSRVGEGRDGVGDLCLRRELAWTDMDRGRRW